MLKLTLHEKKILELLLTKQPDKVAEELKIDVQSVYNAKHRFRVKTKNAAQFLAVAKSKYKKLLTDNIKTPKIMPDDEWCSESE